LETPCARSISKCKNRIDENKGDSKGDSKEAKEEKELVAAKNTKYLILYQPSSDQCTPLTILVQTITKQGVTLNENARNLLDLLFKHGVNINQADDRLNILHDAMHARNVP